MSCRWAQSLGPPLGGIDQLSAGLLDTGLFLKPGNVLPELIVFCFQTHTRLETFVVPKLPSDTGTYRVRAITCRRAERIGDLQEMGRRIFGGFPGFIF